MPDLWNRVGLSIQNANAAAQLSAANLENLRLSLQATLAVGDGLRYFVNRIGGEVAETLQVDSPFDYARQMRVFIPRKMPEPAAREVYEESLAHWIRRKSVPVTLLQVVVRQLRRL